MKNLTTMTAAEVQKMLLKMAPSTRYCQKCEEDMEPDDNREYCDNCQPEESAEIAEQRKEDFRLDAEFMAYRNK